METAVKTIWNVDTSHSEIAFKVKHMMISTVTGHFEDFNAKITTEKENFVEADFKFSAKIDSINTKNKDRDTHLKSDDFFDAITYPEMNFVSKSYDGNTLVGDLTIKNVTQEVNLSVDFNGIAMDPYGQTKAGFEITGAINRKDFDLTWSAVTEAGNVVVGDQVKFAIQLQFIKE